MKPRFFPGFLGKNTILCILKSEMPFKMHKIIYFFKKKVTNLCAYFLKFSHPLPETHLFFYLALIISWIWIAWESIQNKIDSKMKGLNEFDLYSYSYCLSVYEQLCKNGVTLTHISLASYLWDIDKQSDSDQTPHDQILKFK